MTTDARQRLRSARRVVVKIGSNVLTRTAPAPHNADPHTTLDVARIHDLAADIAAARDALHGRAVIVVSSGAVAAGLHALRLATRPTDLAALQAAAAVGQPLLMRAWSEAFAVRDLRVGQMLLSRSGFDRRHRYINTRACLTGLLDANVVPIVNENDTVATEEISLGDNDLLAARLAVAAEADALLLLSSVEGVRDRHGRTRHQLTSAAAVRELARDNQRSTLGTGGMTSKADAIDTAAAGGATSVIAPGHAPRVVTRALDAETIGTAVPPAPTERNPTARKRWLGHAVTPAGTITIDHGAARALRDNGASLLATGCTHASGTFDAGDAVRVNDTDGREIATGLTNFNATELARILGARSEDIPAILGRRTYREVIHRDNLALNTTSTPPA